MSKRSYSIEDKIEDIESFRRWEIIPLAEIVQIYNVHKISIYEWNINLKNMVWKV